MAVPIQQQEMVQYSQRFYLTHFSTMSLRNIYEKIRDVEIDFLNHLGSVFNPNYIAALPNSPNIINHPVIHFHVPTKIFLSPSFSRYSTPPKKKNKQKTSHLHPPPSTLPNLQPPQWIWDTLEVDVPRLLAKVVRALEPPPAAHIPESVEALVASLPSMPVFFYGAKSWFLLIHCWVMGSGKEMVKNTKRWVG